MTLFKWYVSVSKAKKYPKNLYVLRSALIDKNNERFQ